MTRPTLRFRDDPSWIDLYGHMTASRYFELMEGKGFALCEHYGIGPSYTSVSNAGVYTLESRICFLKELREGEDIELKLRILDLDEKRVLMLYELYRASDTEISATLEQLGIHVDLGSRRSTAFPSEVKSRLADHLQSDRSLPLPNDLVGPLKISEWKRQRRM
jgi:acyl-CoA thioester hydrolase